MAKNEIKLIQENLFLKEGDVFEVGNIKYNDTTIISFYLDNYKGIRYANIRNIVISKRFSGPTKKGIKLTKEEISGIVDKCHDLNFDLDTLKDEIFCSIKRTNNIHREIRVSTNLYDGKYGLDIREMYKDKENNFSFGKGIRIKIEYATQALEIISKMNDKFNIKFNEIDKENIKDSNIDITSEKSDGNMKEDKIIDIPEDLNKYF